MTMENMVRELVALGDTHGMTALDLVWGVSYQKGGDVYRAARGIISQEFPLGITDSTLDEIIEFMDENGDDANE